MAQTRDSHFNPSSPRSSSGGADSFKGTPDTRLTAFSPEDGSAKSSKLLKDLARSASATPPVRLPVSSSRGSICHLDKDPFVTPTHGQGTSLSPTASAFRPFTDVVEQTSPGSANPVAATLSTDLGLTRNLDVTSSAPISAPEVDGWLAEQELSGAHQHGGKYLAAVDGRVLIQFADLRDAYSVHASIRSADNDWKADYVNQSQLAKDGITPYDQAAHTSQVLVLAAIPPGCVVDTVQAMESVRSFLESHGRLFAFVRRSTFADGSFRAVAEYCHTSAALPALASCSGGLAIAGVHLVLAPHAAEPMSPSDLADGMQDISITKEREPQNHYADATDSSTPRPMPPSDMRMHPPFAMYPLMLQSPFTPGMPYMIDRFVPTNHASPMAPMTPMAPMSPPYPVVGSLYQTPPSPALTAQHSFSPSRSSAGFGRPDARRQNASRVNRSPYHNAAGHHNHVDVSRIREGIDVRTTIMLRNIPNKVDQAMLKRIVDESSWGKYDFMYLRIDFANDCNVGYAFINFVDPLDIVDFVDARGNQRWNCFKSDKVAEISYATIQGKDCLVQKFRNSSVMLEAPHYRPKLYFTSNGPMPELAGQEEPFPDPDNQSKMKRSCENAEHVGLFTPNAGQHFRDEQRRRRSQYDRGTRLAALEEYDYEAAMQHLYTTGAQ